MWHDDHPGTDVVDAIYYSTNFYTTTAVDIITAMGANRTAVADAKLFMYDGAPVPRGTLCTGACPEPVHTVLAGTSRWNAPLFSAALSRACMHGALCVCSDSQPSLRVRSHRRCLPRAHGIHVKYVAAV